MLWGLDVHMWYQARYRHTRRTCSMVAFFPWQAGERLCEKARGMSFICVRVWLCYRSAWQIRSARRRRFGSQRRFGLPAQLTI